MSDTTAKLRFSLDLIPPKVLDGLIELAADAILRNLIREKNCSHADRLEQEPVSKAPAA